MGDGEPVTPARGEGGAAEEASGWRARLGDKAKSVAKSIDAALVEDPTHHHQPADQVGWGVADSPADLMSWGDISYGDMPFGEQGGQMLDGEQVSTGLRAAARMAKSAGRAAAQKLEAKGAEAAQKLETKGVDLSGTRHAIDRLNTGIGSARKRIDLINPKLQQEKVGPMPATLPPRFADGLCLAGGGGRRRSAPMRWRLSPPRWRPSWRSSRR
jgi:hypothetical protein